MKDEKILMKALQMAGFQSSEQSAALVIGFAKLLEDKGENATLGEIEAVGKAVNDRFKVKQQLQLTK